MILITHIESVREGLDRVITVRYDEDRGCSVIEQPDQAVPLAGIESVLADARVADRAPIDRAADAAIAGSVG